MNVLLSIKPQFAQRIFDGSKGYEYRKLIFNRNDVEKIVVYASSPVKRIIGDFEIDGILYEDVDDLWAKTEHKAGISKELFLEYFKHKSKGYAIKIKTRKSYEVPLTLASLKIKNAPQSFIYLDGTF